MPFDEGLAQRVRELLEDDPQASERKMFGGLAFMLGGNMCCGIVGDELMVRVGPDGYEAALAQPDVREMDFTGRAMRGMVYVSAAGIEGDAELEAWVRRGIEHARSLPPK